jgi:hypothetical protein
MKELWLLCFKYRLTLVWLKDIRDEWSGLSIVISLDNWWIIKGGIYISKEKWYNYALLILEWNVTLILLYYVFLNYLVL